MDSMKVTVRQGFEPSPITSPDLRILIDVFRASTTALAILDKKPSDYLVTNSLETLQSLASQGYRVVSEVFKLGIDNSPTLIQQKMMAHEKVVHKTANLTTAIERNFFDGPMILACFNNFEAVIQYAHRNRFQWIEVIPAGLMGKSSPAKEDSICAEMLAEKILTQQEDRTRQQIIIEDIDEIKAKNEAPFHYYQDLALALRMNISSKIPAVEKVDAGLYRVSSLENLAIDKI